MDAGRTPTTQATPGTPQRREGRVSLLSFDPFSLDIFYYPVSWIMWAWYKLFAFVLGPTNFFAWALSVMFLVFTLRAILYKPFVRQIRTTRQMQELQPQIKALQKKYGKDRQRMALEMQKLQREHGFNPILGCLPMLAQIPVFLGLYHVLRSFNRTQGGFGQPHLSVIQNRLTGNYVFSPLEVQHFLDANLFGAPIGASMTQRSGLEAFSDFSRPAVIAVGVPVMILAGIATYFNSRASIARQSPEAAANPQTAMMNKLALYVFPLGVIVGGPFLPLAIILYWLSNNIWTFGQQHYVFGMIEKEDEAKKQEAVKRRAANAPAPGAKPKRNPKMTPPNGNGSATVSDEDEEPGSPKAGSDGSEVHGPETRTGQTQSVESNPARRNNAPNRTPRPGARPKRRKR
jgi:YidC/Oxa1 family membrane protein insertase